MIPKIVKYLQCGILKASEKGFQDSKEFATVKHSAYPSSSISPSHTGHVFYVVQSTQAFSKIKVAFLNTPVFFTKLGGLEKDLCTV